MSLVTGWDSYGALDSFVFKKDVLRSPNVQRAYQTRSWHWQQQVAGVLPVRVSSHAILYKLLRRLSTVTAFRPWVLSFDAIGPPNPVCKYRGDR